MSGQLFPDVGPITHPEWKFYALVIIHDVLMTGAEEVIPVGSMEFDRIHGDIDLAVKHPGGRAGVTQAFKGRFQLKESGNDLVSVRYPLERLRWVQLDLMVGNPSFLRWSRAGSSNPEFTGADRAVLLNAILRREAIPDAVVRTRYALDFGSGLYVIQQTRKGAKGNLLKEWKTYERKLLSDDPQKIVAQVFGSNASVKNTQSLEGLVATFKESDKYTSEQKARVFTAYRDEMQELVKKNPQAHGQLSSIERLLNI